MRALLTRRNDDYRELSKQIETEDDCEGFARLLFGAFFEAVDRRFAREGDAAIIEFVADMRAENLHLLDDINPSVAEQMIAYTLGRGEIGNIDGATKNSHLIAILIHLTGDLRPDGAALDRLLATARRDAEEW
ncbi:hypothetical protein [Actinomadura madurae]|uniref:hypothetical protein n=1 Tax=Actinomadura madurae TaxID=1993 RepID=UPI0020D2452A|nr:hypothetical protein [Actinomadura madurae]MCP9948664.1 hypothetical protein [Actinomadura madurae]MCP9965436.1 hypothetical protein [Actinomadura madurae]MCP9977927.1 hypothetical protein [Actinomadura madurae]MCQ0010572.1 hypothetical protein [Actinomadura madurae]MCQ0014117.1 hypothetical protein [Actinomadura madurae]